METRCNPQRSGQWRNFPVDPPIICPIFDNTLLRPASASALPLRAPFLTRCKAFLSLLMTSKAPSRVFRLIRELQASIFSIMARSSGFMLAFNCCDRFCSSDMVPFTSPSPRPATLASSFLIWPSSVATISLCFSLLTFLGSAKALSTAKRLPAIASTRDAAERRRALEAVAFNFMPAWAAWDTSNAEKTHKAVRKPRRASSIDANRQQLFELHAAASSAA
mmetsp:Transcript_88784/g.250078  ORF Transcript_88784/g.250078 Transcript_88784/m.250078 type:complete len:221 (+) Transcript_88784:35-697(+)